MFTATFPRAATRKLCGAPYRDHRFIPNNILPLISFLNGNQHRKRRLVSRHTELFFAYYVQSPRVTKKWEKQAGSESLSNDALGTSCISVRGNVLSRAIKPHLFHLILRNIKGPLSEARPHIIYDNQKYRFWCDDYCATYIFHNLLCDHGYVYMQNVNRCFIGAREISLRIYCFN